MMHLIKGVKHEFFGVNFDSGNFRTADPYGDLAKIAPYAVNAQIKTEIHPIKSGATKPTTEEADLKRLVDILKAANYRGYVALEYEAKEDPIKAIPRHAAELRKLIG
jgi:hydroxypyruvate isomerase